MLKLNKLKGKKKFRNVVKKVNSTEIDDIIDVVLTDETVLAIPPKKVQPPTQSKNYWTPDTERSISRYNEAKTSKERNKVYETELKYPFEKLVENIFNTFKFTYFDSGPQQAQADCVSHLMANIEKFNPVQGKGKSFGYFSITAKHFFILINNSNFKKWKNHDSIDPTPENPKELAVDTNKKDTQTDMIEFIKLMVCYWENNVEKMFSKKRDLEIAHAIIELFRKSDRIDCFNKKALYLYVREIAGCKTQNITKVINRMKDSQASIMNDYLEHGSIDRLRYKLKAESKLLYLPTTDKDVEED